MHRKFQYFGLTSKEETYSFYVQAYKQTNSYSAAAKIFGVTPNTIRNAIKWEQNGKSIPNHMPASFYYFLFMKIVTL